jgi:ketosteroid isomerase-like protein/carbon monoxide dehydrogenase subunit G
VSVVTRIRTREELTVPFTPEEVWRVLADVSAYPSWWPGKLNVRVLREGPELLGTEIEVRPTVGRSFCFRFEELEAPHSMRLRFFGGSLEGPGGFHLAPMENATRVRYEIDVFARGLDVAVLSQVFPLRRIHASRMRSLLRSLGSRLKDHRKAAGRAAAEAASREARPAAPSSTIDSSPNFDIARNYLEVLSSAAPPEEISRFFAPEAIDEEFPTRLLPKGVARRLDEILEARARDLTWFNSQSHELRGATGGGSQVAMEILFKGSLAAARDGFSAGQELEYRSAVFLKFQNGRIVRQRTYPCFESSFTESERTLTRAEPVARPDTRSAEAKERSGVPPHRDLRSNFDIARSLLDALNSGAAAEEIASFYADEVVQEEFPNPFLANGASRDLLAIKQARTRSLALLRSEHYDLRGATGGGSQVAMEVHWTGIAGANCGPFVSGQKLEARSAVFLKFRDGLIVRQRNYGPLRQQGLEEPADVTAHHALDLRFVHSRVQ